MWEDFKVRFGKSYGSESEEWKRKQIFIENLNKTQAQNELYAKGLSSFTAGINQFHDMTHSEFFAMTTCTDVYRPFLNPNRTIYNNSRKLGKDIDWRTKGYVTPVKDQGRCRACWAFTVTGTLEGLNARKTGQLVSLSAQNLIDCAGNYGNKGCNGGFLGKTFQFVAGNGGINSETSYPFEGIDGTCRYQPNATAATCDSFVFTRGESNIQAVVSNFGPVATAIFVNENLKIYKGGIFDDDTCNGNSGHAMLIVGYGTDSTTGKDYWIVKNSWGTTWGMDGYVLVARNKLMCGIGYFSQYPVLFGDQFHRCAEREEDD